MVSLTRLTIFLFGFWLRIRLRIQTFIFIKCVSPTCFIRQIKTIYDLKNTPSLNNQLVLIISKLYSFEISILNLILKSHNFCKKMFSPILQTLIFYIKKENMLSDNIC